MDSGAASASIWFRFFHIPVLDQPDKLHERQPVSDSEQGRYLNTYLSRQGKSKYVSKEVCK